MFKFNMDVEKRDEFLFGGYDPYNYKYGGICRLGEVTVQDIEFLLENNFINPGERYNNSPSTMEIFEFLKENPKFVAFGYTVSPDREGYGVVLEGVICKKTLTVDELKEFVKFARFADELDVDPYYRAWWD